MGIFQGQAELWRHAQQFGCLQERIGRGFVPGIVAVRHDLMEAVDQVVDFQVTPDGGPRGRRGDGARQAEFVEQVEKLQHAGLQKQLPIDQLVENPPCPGFQLVSRECRTITIEKKAVDNGMLTLRRSGLTKVALGMTTIEEIVRETVFDEEV